MLVCSFISLLLFFFFVWSFSSQVFFLLSIHFNVAPHVKTSNDFFFFLFSLNLWLKNEHQAICVYTAEFIKIFRALISLTLQNKHTGTGYYNAVGWRSLAEMFILALLMETWTLSRVWTFGLNQCEKVSFILVWIISMTLYCTQYCVQFHTTLVLS